MSAKDFIRRLGRHLYWNTQTNPAVLYDPIQGDMMIAKVNLFPRGSGGAEITWFNYAPREQWHGKPFASADAAKQFVEQRYFRVYWNNEPIGEAEKKTPLFVYGTLRRGAEAHDKMADCSSPVRARTAAKYTVTDRDGDRSLSLGGTEAVEGELYQVCDDKLKELDAWERGHFERGTVTLDDGTEAQAYFRKPMREGAAKDFLKRIRGDLALSIRIPPGWEGMRNYAFRDVWYNDHGSTYLGVIYRVDDPEGHLADCPPGYWRISKVGFWHSPVYIRNSWPTAQEAAMALLRLFKGQPVGESAKEWLKQNVMPPEPAKNWRGKKYGRLIHYKNYKIVRHDYPDGSIILALYYWNPRKLFWTKKKRPGEELPDLVRRAAWEEAGNPVKLQPGDNWPRYWIRLKALLDTSPYPSNRRWDNLQLPRPEERER